MPVLYRREVPLRTVVAVTAPQARALQAPIRLAILDLLSVRPMSIEELAEELPDHGFRKAPNTLRHHVELLRKAELIELALLEQSRGAVLKYYASAARPLHYEIPANLAGDVDAMAARILPAVRSTMAGLARSQGGRLRRVADGIRPCSRCPTEYFTDYVQLEVLHRACLAFLRERGAANDLGPGGTGNSRRTSGGTDRT